MSIVTIWSVFPNPVTYFVSHNQLHLLPGQHYINSDLVLELIYNFTLSGHGINQSVIICPSPVKIILQYIDNFTIQNVALINCMGRSTSSFYSSILIYYCSRIYIQNLYINISYSTPADITGIHLMNVLSSKIVKVKMQINVLICYNRTVIINGLSVYYNGNNDIYVR